MKRAMVSWLVASGALLVAASVPTAAQDGGNPGEDVSVLQTQVARQATQIARLTTRVADLEASTVMTVIPPGRGGDEPSDPTPIATASPIRDGTEVGLGDTVGTATIDIVASGTDVLPSFVFTDEEVVPRGVFLVVYLSVTNTGGEPFTFPFTELALRDGEGRKFSLDEDSTNRYNIVTTDVFRTTDMQPGLTYETAALFDVPTDASGFVLTTAMDTEVFTVALDR